MEIIFGKEGVNLGLEEKADILFYKNENYKITSPRYYVLQLQKHEKKEEKIKIGPCIEKTIMSNPLLFELYFNRLGNLTGGREVSSKSPDYPTLISSWHIEKFFEKYNKLIIELAKTMPKNVCGLMGSLFSDSEEKIKKTADDADKLC
jgi:hypothetical protein